jgi:hypothetical protein
VVGDDHGEDAITRFFLPSDCIRVFPAGDDTDLIRNSALPFVRVINHYTVIGDVAPVAFLLRFSIRNLSRQREVEDAAHAGLAFNPNLPAEPLYDA